MKHYVIDELRYQDYEAVKAYLDAHMESSGFDGLYWYPIDGSLLTDIQKSHTACAPFYFALALEENKLSCEFLIRTNNRIRCDCMAYASEAQRNWIIQFVDGIFEKLGIIT